MTENTTKEDSTAAAKSLACILIVDDDQDILDSLANLFEMVGKYKVETAINVHSVKEKLKHFNPEIVLLDVSLGSCSGLELIPLIKYQLPDTDFIMMTGYREVDYAVKALRYGAVDYLFKPIDPERLLQILEDYFHQRRIRQEASNKEQNIKTIFDQASGFIFLLSPEGICLEASHAALTYVGQQRDKVIGRLIWQTPWWQHSKDAGNQLQSAIVVASSGQSPRLEVEISDQQGRKSWFEFSFKPIIKKGKKVSRIIAEAHDLTERKLIEQNLKKMALYDPLTGLANRILLHEHLENTIAHAARNNQQFAVIFIDLDNFKLINDSLGHQTGDELLVNVGRRLKSCVREEDVIARVGGDEFVIVLSSESDKERTRNAVVRLMQSIAELVSRESYDGVVSASIGIAIFPNDGCDVNSLLCNADTAMYRAKKQGKSCFKFFSGQCVESECTE